MVVSYEYDDQGRVSRTYTGSQWTAEDRALMLARQSYKRGLCTGCGLPVEKAWHPDNDGWIKVAGVYTCHGCTAQDNYDRAPGDPIKPREYPVVVDTRDYTVKPLPPMPEPRQRRR